VWGVERRGAGPGPGDFVTYRGATMATTVAVTLPAGPAAEGHARAVLAVFREVDARMSEWKDSSPLAAVNRAAGIRPVAVPEDLRRVLNRARRIGEATDGAFDITWAALWGLWDFKAAEPRLPPAEEVARRAALVDFRQLEIDDDAGTVFLPHAGMTIGLGGIAKGHALDRAAALLAARSVDDYLIAAGGQVMARGDRGGRPWRVGIRDPRGGPDDAFARVEVRDASLSTSGDYESFFVVDGVRYHHILDPRTGWPARGLRSATVIAADATLADALSTALIALGAERGMAVAERLGVEAVLIDAEGRVAVTAGLAGALEVLHPLAVGRLE
jgi:FAD:protein FMN transferase